MQSIKKVNTRIYNKNLISIVKIPKALCLLDFRFYVCHLHAETEELLLSFSESFSKHPQPCDCTCSVCATNNCGKPLDRNVTSWIQRFCCKKDVSLLDCGIDNKKFNAWDCLSVNCEHCCIGSPNGFLNCPVFFNHMDDDISYKVYEQVLPIFNFVKHQRHR